jgi:glycosyltransferase involved in cell wall biosynthesis
MNICYLIHSFSNRAGTESYVYHMSMAMAELGHNVHIVSLTGRGRWDFEEFNNRISVHKIDLGKDVFGRFRKLEDIFPLAIWRYGRSIKRLLPILVKDHAIDIVEATDWGMDAWAYLSIRQVPVCVRLHGYPGFKEEFESELLKKLPKNYIQWLFQREHILNADLVTGVSEAYSDFVRQAWEIREKEIQIIPIAVDLKTFHPTDASRDDHSILFAGRLEKLKGIATLARAIPTVLKEFPQTRFYFAGVDHRYNNTHQTWSQHLLESYGRKNIVYLGSLSTKEIVMYYQRSTVCVVPSLYEPGATIAFEAMACGCPVLASRAGGLAEIIKDRQTGLLTPPGDAAALADGLIELLSKKQWRQELSQRALDSIHQNFDLDRIVRRTLAAYSDAIETFKNGN